MGMRFTLICLTIFTPAFFADLAIPAKPEAVAITHDIGDSNRYSTSLSGLGEVGDAIGDED